MTTPIHFIRVHASHYDVLTRQRPLRIGSVWKTRAGWRVLDRASGQRRNFDSRADAGAWLQSMNEENAMTEITAVATAIEDGTEYLLRMREEYPEDCDNERAIFKDWLGEYHGDTIANAIHAAARTRADNQDPAASSDNLES